MKSGTAVAVALTWRITLAIFTCTFFQPDEFYQSLEVAHRAVFGYGHLTWEWASTPPIRSPFFPSLYMPIYWIIKVMNLDSGYAVIVGPKMLQGAFAAVADISTRELARRVLGPRYTDAAFFLSLTSLFNVLALSRTFSNSLETSLAATAMCFWDAKSTPSKHFRMFLVSVALGCLVRPTSAIIYVFPYLKHLRHSSRKMYAIIESVVISVPALLLNLLVDSVYYGTLTFTPLNFVVTNLSSVSLFYGRAPWHYYLSQGLPILLNTSLPLFVAGTYSAIRRTSRKDSAERLRDLVCTIVCTALVYSLLGHKEWRFLHPLLPFMLVIASKPLVDGFSATNLSTQQRPRGWNRIAMWTAIASLIPGLYLMRWHGRAQIEVMHHLRSLPPSELRSVGFLVPCHSTPWQSYLHRPELNASLLWSLSCEPPLNIPDPSTYRDQADVFYESPLRYLKRSFPETVDPVFPPSPFPSTKPGDPPPEGDLWDHRWPSHLVFFKALINGPDGERLARYLEELGYTEVWSISNGFEEDPRRRGGVKVWAWRP